MATDAVLLLVLGRSMQDDDANGMMENDLNDKIDCHVKVPI